MLTATFPESDTAFCAGDVVACWGRDLLSRTISAATSWPFGAPRWSPSHLAIIAPHNGRLRWFESTSRNDRPCLVARIRISGAQVHPIRDRAADWLRRGGRVSIYRAARTFNPREAEHLGRVVLVQHVFGHRRYDYAGAALSGSRLLGWLPGADLEALFCSELVLDALKATSRFCASRNPAVNPGRALRILTRSGEYLRKPARTWQFRLTGDHDSCAT